MKCIICEKDYSDKDYRKDDVTLEPLYWINPLFYPDVKTPQPLCSDICSTKWYSTNVYNKLTPVQKTKD